MGKAKLAHVVEIRPNEADGGVRNKAALVEIQFEQHGTPFREGDNGRVCKTGEAAELDPSKKWARFGEGNNAGICDLVALG